MGLADTSVGVEKSTPGLTKPLNRAAAALVLNGGLTSVLGIGYWLVAAHLYLPTVVGRNSALVAALVTLSGFAQCNFARSLSGLLPRAGARAARLLGRVYLATVIISLLLGFTFCVVAPRLVARLGYLRGPALLLPGFTIAVAIWSIFTLEDTALASLRSARIVPIENATFGVLKIGLLVFLHSRGFGMFSILASWIVPLVVIVPPVNWYLFKRALPRGRDFAAPPEPGPLAVRNWVAYDYAGYLFWLAGTLPLPLLVLPILGSSAAAVFYVTFAMSTSMDVVSLNVGNAFTAELQRQGGVVGRDALAFLAKLWSLILFVAVVLGLAAPYVLQLFGARYRAQGHVVMVILLAAAVPRSVMFLGIAAARAQGRGRVILAAQMTASLGTLGLGVALMARIGLDGMAWAWFAASAVGAALAVQVIARPFHRVTAVPA